MGKTYHNLYSHICDPDNLWRAYKQAARGKRMTPPVAAFEYDLEAHLLNLEAELRAQTYMPGGYYNFVQGWLNHARYGDTWGLRRAVLAAAGLGWE